MATLKLTLEYDGTGYAGWQRQVGQPTVQGEIEGAIRHITQADHSLIGAGRTDAGVHALGQVASFRSDKDLGSENWTRALNAVLPKDITVLRTETVPDAFHARYSAKRKRYDYRLFTRQSRSALERHRHWHLHGPLNLDAMRAAASLIVGTHDFSSFQGHPTDTEDPMCEVERMHVVQAEPFVHIEVVANRFLKQMVRAMVGTLVEVGQGKRTPESLKDMLSARDRRAAGQTAPAHGLYLVRVDY